MYHHGKLSTAYHNLPKTICWCIWDIKIVFLSPRHNCDFFFLLIRSCTLMWWLLFVPTNWWTLAWTYVVVVARQCNRTKKPREGSAKKWSPVSGIHGCIGKKIWGTRRQQEIRFRTQERRHAGLGGWGWGCWVLGPSQWTSLDPKQRSWNLFAALPWPVAVMDLVVFS